MQAARSKNAFVSISDVQYVAGELKVFFMNH